MVSFERDLHGIDADGLGSPDTICVIGGWELSLVLSDRWQVPLRASFTYRSDDPYAVHLGFYLGTQNPVRWVFARRLLTTALERPAGHADVRVWLTHEGTLVSLCLESLHGDALLEMPVDALSDWLDRTYDVVPPGQEHHFLDLDKLVENLLEGTPKISGSEVRGDAAADTGEDGGAAGEHGFR